MQEPDARHQPFKMIIFQADPAIFYFDRFKKAIPVSETTVIGREDRLIGGKDRSIEIQKIGSHLLLNDDSVFYCIHDETGHGFCACFCLELVPDGFHRTGADIDNIRYLFGSLFFTHQL